MGYRICKNKYGYYKIQRRQKKIKLLGITFCKEWVDHYHPRLIIFNSAEKAQKQIDRFMENDQRQNKDWVCI